MKFYHLLAIGAIALFASCEKETHNPTQKELDKKETYHVIGRSIAKSIAKPEVKSFIEEEASKLEYGDYEFLLSGAIKKEVNGESFLQIIARNAGKKTSEIEEMISNYPKITLAVHNPIQYKNQSATAVNTYIVEEEVVDSLYGYTPAGNTCSILAATEPTTPVLLIKDNERVFSVEIDSDAYQLVKEKESNGHVFDYPIYEDNTTLSISMFDYFKLRLDTIQQNSNKVNSCNPVGCPTTADRDSRNKKDVVNNFSFQNNSCLNDVEPWYYLGPEFQLTIVMADCSGADSPIIHPWGGTRSDYLNGNVHTLPYPLTVVNWIESTWGSRMYYHIQEIDKKPELSTKLTLTMSTTFNIGGQDVDVEAEIEIAYHPDNDLVGAVYVEYCDPADWWDTFRYAAGGFIFQVWEKHN